MPVPNNLTRVINKLGEIVNFDLSKIHRSITTAIKDIEHAKDWEAESRALKYSELVQKKIYNRFYDLAWNVQDTIAKCEGLDDDEFKGRLEREDFQPRLTVLLMLHYFKKSFDPTGKVDQTILIKFIQDLFEKKQMPKQRLPIIAEILTDKVMRRSKEVVTESDYYPDREVIQDTIEQELIGIGEICVAEGFMIYREGRKKVHGKEITEPQFTHDGVHREMLRKTMLWNINHECDSVFSLNSWVLGNQGKTFGELVRLSEERFYQDIERVVTQILSRKEDIKLVVIAGPSCSNKTTITRIIGNRLTDHRLRLKLLNVDDYFFPLSEHQKDRFGDYDFEMPDALDLEMLEEHLSRLAVGEAIKKPIYDFKKGDRIGYEDFSIDSEDIILIDCLHGLYRKVTASVPAEKKFKIYTESMNVLRNTEGSYTKWTDVRLCKRMMRDNLYRNYDPKKTLGHWGYVRKGELKHIKPYIYTVDAVINSGLPYELPVLKSRLKDAFPSMAYIKQLRVDGRFDSYIRGIRTSSLLNTIIPFHDMAVIPNNSPIREFIGGSSYEIAHNT